MKIKTLLLHLLYLAVIAVYAFLIGCPVKRFFGIDCPFCGMTRAHVALFCGDLNSAIGYHELFYLGIPTMLGVAHLRVLKKKRAVFIAVTTFCSLSAVAFIVRYILILI